MESVHCPACACTRIENSGSVGEGENGGTIYVAEDMGTSTECYDHEIRAWSCLVCEFVWYSK